MALDTIVTNKHEEVASRKAASPLTTFRPALAPSTRSLRDALAAPRTGYIMECKKASPSRGLIRADFDLTQIATTYARYADAISVLADEKFFQGSLDFVKQVSEIVSLPVLCKDFTVDPYQVYEARRFGADAVLLMLSVLDDETYLACSTAARAQNVDILTEVHDEAELTRALALGAKIIGINNRNLKNLAVDLNVSRRLAPKVPKGKVVVIESGISTHQEVLGMRDHCHGFLVGSSLMSCPDIDRACRELVYGPVKVCGLTRPGDAASAYRCGASFGGLIFAAKSPRVVTSAQAKTIRAGAPLDWVGVFVNAKEVEVATLASRLSLKSVQLHGDETPDYIDRLRPALPEDCAVWKALKVGDEVPLLDGTGADRVLLDTASKTARGGTGKRFDWSLLSGRDLTRVILSGGLSPASAKGADAVGAAMLDVNSGIERTPGIKDDLKLSQFFEQLRGATEGQLR